MVICSMMDLNSAMAIKRDMLIWKSCICGTVLTPTSRSICARESYNQSFSSGFVPFDVKYIVLRCDLCVCVWVMCLEFVGEICLWPFMCCTFYMMNNCIHYLSHRPPQKIYIHVHTACLYPSILPPHYFYSSLYIMPVCLALLSFQLIRLGTTSYTINLF